MNLYVFFSLLLLFLPGFVNDEATMFKDSYAVFYLYIQNGISIQNTMGALESLLEECVSMLTEIK